MKFFAEMQKPTREAIKFFAEMQKPAQENNGPRRSAECLGTGLEKQDSARSGMKTQSTP
jgi:hypothetical protein